MAVTATVLAILSTILVLIGFYIRILMKALGGIVLVNGSIYKDLGVVMLIFGLAYMVQYLLTLCKLFFDKSTSCSYLRDIKPIYHRSHAKVFDPLFSITFVGNEFLFLILGGLIMARPWRKKKNKSEEQ
ncbi:hypothetical protein RF11_15025 [Thelohanellus kitauei]|uniref:Uncharacterized protein n=1 Tax=Thelohanellus kitauei TaxID=669202 RepID=A0A0C2M9W1_THEKT|nr:hypothetical protein RF11_15025 [Thelohanellus kitauei]